MPGMNGAEFLNRVMELYPSTIRLVLSGHADQDLILKVEGAAHQLLTKPCDPELLRSVILRACASGAHLSSERIRKVLGGITHLPVIPAIYTQIMHLLDLEATTVADLGRVVKQDPGMTANILKLVNSAYFGLRQQVSDPGEAISFLGVDTLKSMALFHGIFTQAAGFPPHFDSGHLWRHSFALATAAREVAILESLDRETQSECFTGGLLHDAGLMVLASAFKAEYGQIAQDLAGGAETLSEVEARILGVDHGEVGAHILGLWGLPGSIVAAVAGHHAVRAADTLGPALVVQALEAFSATEGDYRVFGVCREGEVQFPALLPESRLDAWKRTLTAMPGEPS